MPEKRALDFGQAEVCPECEFTWDYLRENGCFGSQHLELGTTCRGLREQRGERQEVSEPLKSAEQEIEEFATVLFSIDDIVPVLRSMARRIDVLENHKAIAEHDGKCPDCGEFRSTIEGAFTGDCALKRRAERVDHCAWSQAERPEQL